MKATIYRKFTLFIAIIMLVTTALGTGRPAAAQPQSAAPIQSGSRASSEGANVQPAERLDKKALSPAGGKSEPKAPVQDASSPDLITASTYPFSTAAGVALENMATGTTQLLGASQDDVASSVFNIGFDYWFDGVRYAQLSANSNGLVRLGSVATSGTASNTFTDGVNDPKLSAYWDDLCTSSTGKVHYKVIGTAPNRKLVVEFLNMIQYSGGCTAGVSAGTFQVWLYESSHSTTPGVVEFVYGAIPTNSNTFTGYSVGFSSSSTSFASVTTTGPTVSYAASNNTQTASIAAGTAYIFTPNVPAAPTGLSFTAITASSMTLNWTDNATNEAGYVIYSSTDNVNFTFATQAAANATSANVTGLTPSTTYFWRVYAVSEGALSSPALTGSQATTAPGNKSANAGAGNWSNPATWTPAGVPTSADIVTIPTGAIVTIDIAASAYALIVQSGGILQYEATTARTLTVVSSVTIDTGGTFQSAATGTVTTHVLSVGTDLTNNGTLDFSTNTNTAGAGITFTGAANNTFGGTGAVTDIRTITINKGTSNANVLELNTTNFTVRGTTTDSTSAAYLTLTNGTFKISGTFTAAFRTFTTASYSIPATTGFWLNNPNYTVSGQNGSPTISGLLRLTQGTYNVGTATGNQTSGSGTYIIEGGTMNVTGRLTLGSSATYTQSSGTVNVSTIGNTSASFASFDALSTVTLNMSGGTINLVQAATSYDWWVDGIVNVTGSGTTVNVGTGATVTSFNFKLRGNMPNVVIDNTTNNKTATFVSTTIIYGNVTVNTGTTFNLNGFLVAPGGATFTNNGTVTGTTVGSRLYFANLRGTAQTYTGTGVVTAGLQSLELDNALGLTFDPTVSNLATLRVIIFAGSFTNSNKITIGNGGTTTGTVQIGNTTTPTAAGSFDVSPTWNLGTGGEVLIYMRETNPRTTGFEINPTRIVTSMTVDNNVNPVTLAGGDLTLSSTTTALTLTNGRFITLANTLILSSGTATVTRTNGYVDGNFRKTYTAVGSKTFEVGTANGYSPAAINVTTLTTNPSSMTVKAVQGPQPILDPLASLKRYWTLTEIGDMTANLTFTYLDPTDIAGTEANYRAIRVIGGTAVTFLNTCPTPPTGQACVDTTANTILVPGVVEFSDWTAGEPVAPTLARIESVNATRAGDGSGTLVQWKTGYEAANLGFNLYRSEGEKGQRVQVNPSLVAGSAFSAAGAAPAGQFYSWTDTSAASANTRYWVEDVDLNGTRTMHGPYATTVGKQAATGNSTLLSSLGQTQGASKGVERSAAIPKSDGPASTRPVTGQPAIKLSVKGEGLYRVGQPELLAAGLNANVDPRNLQLYAEGQQIPVRVNGEADGRLDSRDSVEFYGLGLDTPTTNTHVYWLVAGQQPGQRISQSQAAGNLQTGGNFPYAVERKDRTVYFSSLLNGEAENFFGPVVSSAGVAQTLTVANLDSAAAGQAQLQVTLQGATLQGHSVSVKLNGTNVGSLTFTGRERGTATFSVPQSSLVQGVNTVTLTATGAGSDISLVDSVPLTYAHLYRADADALRFTAQGGSQITIAGFTGQQVRVLDVTNANAPAELTGTVRGSKAEGYSVSLTVPGAGQRTLVALLNTQLSAVSRVAADRPSSWGTIANSADLIIIAHGSLVSSVQPLATLRESQGYKVAIVDVEDVYDEFSYGAHTPQALRDFLTYASNSWQYKPRYLLLAGDSTFDPKDYLNRGDLDLVPTRLIDTLNMETASDDWLAGYNRDGDARLAVGRLPVSTVAEANAVIAKIAGYAPGSTQPKAVLVADNDSDGFSFESISHAIANLISRYVQIQEINRSGGTTSEVRQRILDAINAGPMLVNYMGHGNVDTWTGAGLLTSADANALTNGNRLPFFVMMTCLNGYTQDPTFSSLAEALVRAPNGGAIASWASSGMTTPEQQAAMSQELYAAIFSGTPTHDIPLPIAPTLGDAIIRAKATISNPDVRNTWILFGDPTTKLR